MVIDSARDQLRAYYTNSPEIGRFMVSRLNVDPHQYVWEPSAGDGALVSALLERQPLARVRASEVAPSAQAALRQRFAEFPNVEVADEDSLLMSDGLFQRDTFERVLANPPYGAWQEHGRRRSLKSRHPGIYVKESYAVFLWQAFTRLERDGRLVFIIPDTFLWLNRHQVLRRRLLQEGTFEEIALFPSRFFPGVSFGYSGLCILTIVRGAPREEHRIRMIYDIKSPKVLESLAVGDAAESNYRESMVLQQSISSQKTGSFAGFRAAESSVAALAGVPLGSIADVVTGFYSGNDARWLRRGSTSVRRSDRYAPVDLECVTNADMCDGSLDGINHTRCFVPIVRGGAATFRKPTDWYVDWSVSAVAEYRRRGKNPARFQNSKYYFRDGIGVPMVRSKRLSAAMLESRLFDQGIVGVFPFDGCQTQFLLGFLNSSLASRQIAAINPSANNSANYLRQLVVPSLSEELVLRVEQLVAGALSQSGTRFEHVLEKLDEVFDRRTEFAASVE